MSLLVPGLILQNWPLTLYFFSSYQTLKIGENSPKRSKNGNRQNRGKSSIKTNFDIFWHFWEYKSGIGYFIPPKVTLLAQNIYCFFHGCAKYSFSDQRCGKYLLNICENICCFFYDQICWRCVSPNCNLIKTFVL